MSETSAQIAADIRGDQEPLTGPADEELGETFIAGMRLDGAQTILKCIDAEFDSLDDADQRETLLLAAQLSALATDNILAAARRL